MEGFNQILGNVEAWTVSSMTFYAFRKYFRKINKERKEVAPTEEVKE